MVKQKHENSPVPLGEGQDPENPSLQKCLFEMQEVKSANCNDFNAMDDWTLPFFYPAFCNTVQIKPDETR
jgi:hypothetical protein